MIQCRHQGCARGERLPQHDSTQSPFGVGCHERSYRIYIVECERLWQHTSTIMADIMDEADNPLLMPERHSQSFSATAPFTVSSRAPCTPPRNCLWLSGNDTELLQQMVHVIERFLDVSC